MASQIEIINVALSRIGANEITSLSDGTTEQKLAVNFWDTCRRELLRSHPWNFAIADIELAQIDGYQGFDYQYSYQLPSNFLRLLEFYGNPDYRVQGRQIVTDSSICKIRYIKDITDTSLWDSSFVDLLAQRLAVDLAFPLTKSQATADSMFALFDRKLKMARFIDSTEDPAGMLGGNSSPYIGVRG